MAARRGRWLQAVVRNDLWPQSRCDRENEKQRRAGFSFPWIQINRQLLRIFR